MTITITSFTARIQKFKASILQALETDTVLAG